MPQTHYISWAFRLPIFIMMVQIFTEFLNMPSCLLHSRSRLIIAYTSLMIWFNNWKTDLIACIVLVVEMEKSEDRLYPLLV